VSQKTILQIMKEKRYLA